MKNTTDNASKNAKEEKIRMLDFSDPSYTSVDWTVILAFLLVIGAGTALLYRALARLFLRR